MRATRHNGRWGSAKHNERDFDVSKAGHIDAARSSDNMYWTWAGDIGLQDAERKYYEENFGEALAAQNARHIAARNYSRVKTMEQLVSGRNSCPEETLLQIGNMKAGTDADDFTACIADYLAWEDTWAKDHGNPCKLLTAAVHVDEASPHAHLRRVWQHKDKDGNLTMGGMAEALEAAGVPLPDPAKPVGKMNNRKMTFDRICRDKWVEICEAHGYVIEHEPDPKHKSHLSKAEFIELQERTAELDARENEISQRERQLRDREQVLQRKEAALEAATRAADKTMAEYRAELETPSEGLVGPSDAALIEFAKRKRMKSGRTLYETMSADMQREQQQRQQEAKQTAKRKLSDAEFQRLLHGPEQLRDIDYGTGGRTKKRDTGMEL